MASFRPRVNGFGLYAPCMIMISSLGVNPTAAFPVMMGSCALLMLAAGIQFVTKARYDLRAALGLVVFVVLYTAISLLRSPAAESRAQP